MKNTKLNTKRPYGMVSGHPEIRYEQDGNLYRHDGSLYSESSISTAPPPTVDPLPELPLPDANNKRADAMRRIWAERRAAKEREAQEEIE